MPRTSDPRSRQSQLGPVSSPSVNGNWPYVERTQKTDVLRPVVLRVKRDLKKSSPSPTPTPSTFRGEEKISRPALNPQVGSLRPPGSILVSIVDQQVTSVQIPEGSEVTTQIMDNANRAVRVALSHVAGEERKFGGWVTGQESAQGSTTQTRAELRPPDPARTPSQ